MAEAKKTPFPAAPQPDQANADLSDMIDRTMEKKLGEQLKTVRVFDNYYRCNWWVQDTPAERTYSSGKISRSQFVKARLNDGNLVIENASHG